MSNIETNIAYLILGKLLQPLIVLPGVHVAIAGIDRGVIRHATAKELGLLFGESHRVHHEKSTLTTFVQRSADGERKGQVK